jgi:hypothetical protein
MATTSLRSAAGGFGEMARLPFNRSCPFDSPPPLILLIFCAIAPV